MIRRWYCPPYLFCLSFRGICKGDRVTNRIEIQNADRRFEFTHRYIIYLGNGKDTHELITSVDLGKNCVGLKRKAATGV